MTALVNANGNMEANMRRIILNLAISLDGFIADTSGGFDWIKGHGDNSQDAESKFEFGDFLEGIDIVIMGRKAYDDSGELTLDSVEGFSKKRIIVTTSRELKVRDGIETYNGDLCKLLLELREEEGKDIWLFGGAGSIDPVIKANSVDEYIIGIIPVILGSGRPLFLKDNPMIELHLDEYTVNDGIPIMKYSKK